VRLAVRKERSAPKLAAFETWLHQHRARVSAKSPLGGALKYIAKYWDGLNLFLANGCIEMDNNAVERTIRPIALSRKNALFAGHDAGAENWGIIASLIETCKLNGIEPHAYLTPITLSYRQRPQTKPDRRTPALELRRNRVIGASLTRFRQSAHPAR